MYDCFLVKCSSRPLGALPFGLLTDAAFSFLLLFYVVNPSSGIDSEHGSKLHIRSAPLFQADFFFSFEGMRNAREFLECLRKPHQLCIKTSFYIPLYRNFDKI